MNGGSPPWVQLIRQWIPNRACGAPLGRTTGSGQSSYVPCVRDRTLAGDLDEVAVRAGEDGGQCARLLSSATHAVRGDSHLAEAVRRHVVEGHLEALRLLLRRAVERGEVSMDCPAIAYFPQLVLGAMLSQRAVTGADADAAYLRSHFTCVVLLSLDHRPR
ncbi:TetR/AcrR family transcriptional regulator C-terminal ligand-binding domain-containing protein [Streptomyces sp. NPDC055254]